MFFAPSDLSGLYYGMQHEYICSCPMWRNEGPCSDCIFVVTDPQAEGMCGLDAAHVLCCFLFNYMGKLYPCAVVWWFVHGGDMLECVTYNRSVHTLYTRYTVYKQYLQVYIHLSTSIEFELSLSCQQCRLDSHRHDFHQQDGPNTDEGLWVVCLSYHACKIPDIAIIEVTQGRT